MAFSPDFAAGKFRAGSTPGPSSLTGIGYDPNANASGSTTPSSSPSAPSTPTGTAAPAQTNDGSFKLKGFNQPFSLQTVKPGAQVPTGGTTRKATTNLTDIPSEDRSSFIKNAPVTADVTSVIQQFDNWDNNKYTAFKAQAYTLGLTASKNASKTQVALAWQTVVETASQEGLTPTQVLSKATSAGSWNDAPLKSGVHPNDVGASGTGNKNSGQDTQTTTNINTGTQTNATTTTQGTNTTDTTANSTTQSQAQQATTTKTSYISYLDPATVQGITADAFYRLLGRNPTPQEYQAVLSGIYNYEDQANTGKFESGVVLKSNQKVDEKTGQIVDKTTGKVVSENDVQRVGQNTGGVILKPGQKIDSKTGQVVDTKTGAVISDKDVQRTQTANQNVDTTGDTTTQKNIVSQRGLGTRGAQFIAAQSAMANPEEGAYQASTTYFHALMQALSGPAAGMQASGPTNTAP